MNAYSLDLRKKIVEAKERGTPTAEVARTFGVGLSFRQALRRHRTRRKAARSEEAPRLQTEARRSGEEAAGSGPRRAPCGDAPAKARVSGACGGSTGERFHRLADARAYGMEPEKKIASIATMVLATSGVGGLTRKKEGFVPFQRSVGRRGGRRGIAGRSRT